MSTPHLASCQGLRWHLRREALSIDPYRISTMAIFDGTTASMPPTHAHRVCNPKEIPAENPWLLSLSALSEISY